MQRLIRSRTGWLAIAFTSSDGGFCVAIISIADFTIWQIYGISAGESAASIRHSCGARENLHDGRENASSCGA